MPNLNGQKFATEMDIDEFKRWSTEYVVDQFLTNGLKGIKSSIHLVIDQSSLNEVFGGGKPNSQSVCKTSSPGANPILHRRSLKTLP